MLFHRMMGLVLIVIIMFGVFAYMTYKRSGDSWMPDFSLPAFLDFSKPPVMQPLPEISEPTYKWRENGRWVYGDKPPPGITAIKLNKDPG